MPVFFISLCLVALLFIAYALYHAKRLKAAQRGPSAGPVSSGPEKRENTAIPVRAHTVPDEKTAMLEDYPALRGIHHIPVKEGLFPVSHFTVDEKAKKDLEARASILPNVQTTSLRLLGLLQTPQSNPNEITSLVSTNPVFSAKILQVINSAYFKQFESVTSVGRAITLLGYNNVRSLVLEDILQNTLPSFKDNNRELYVKIWTHSAAVSTCAGHLGKILFQLPEYTLGTIGLLHDIGKYFFQLLERRDVFAKNLPADLPAVIREEKWYGMNHALVGAIIAHKWQLPDVVTETIEHHHAPSFLPPEGVPGGVVKESFIICLSDLICKALGYTGQDEDLPALKKEYYERFGLTGDLYDLVTPSLIRDIEKAHLTVLSYVKTGSSQ